MSLNYDERLEKFRLNGLGLANDNVVRLSNHNERWKRIFSDEAYLILHSLNIESLKIYHCGSTAIPNIKAKPIIDIVGSVKTLAEIDRVKNSLEQIGYEYKGEYGITGRRYSVLYDSKKEISFCHLHIFKEGSSALSEHLGFRDYLRIDSDAAAHYESCKEALNVPRDVYSKSKNSTINDLLITMKPYYFPQKKAKMLAIIGSSEGGEKTLDYLKKSFEGEELKIINLLDLKFSPYNYSSKYDKDDFSSVMEEIIEADRVIFATPVYWYSMSGVMKDFIDRFSDLLSGTHKELGKKLYGKKVDLLSTGADLELPNGFTTPFNLTATYFGMDFMNVYYKCTGNE